jgi:hypothetical protein
LFVRADNALAVGAFNWAEGESSGAIFSVGIGEDGARANALEPLRHRIVVVSSRTPEELSSRIDRRLKTKSRQIPLAVVSSSMAECLRFSQLIGIENCIATG